jgi:hypothetical protein
MTVATVVLYHPLLFMASGTSQIVEGFNYVADTLLFGGMALLVASAMPSNGLPDTESH